VPTGFADRTDRHARRMRAIEEVRQVLALVDAGLNDCEIERRTNIPRRTILGWRHGRVPRFAKSDAPASCRQCGHPEHDFLALPGSAYPYLLGLYLGDGFIAKHARTFRLTIFMDRAYPLVVLECADAMAHVMPTSKVSVLQRAGEQTDEINSYSKAWPCVFPQHGEGKKHLRSIELTDWQWQLVEQQPGRLLRGLMHSDGCRSVNTIRHPKKTYVYPRYLFTNYSDDIKRIFCRACDLIGIEWRVMNAKTISIARCESVALMDEFVGPKR
jgi:hypothetical protein